MTRASNPAARGTAPDGRAVADLVDVPVWALDDDLSCHHANASWTRLTGQARDAALGEGWRRCIRTEDLPALLGALASFDRASPPVAATVRLRTPRGWAACAVAADRSGSGWWLTARARPAPTGSWIDPARSPTRADGPDDPVEPAIAGGADGLDEGVASPDREWRIGAVGDRGGQILGEPVAPWVGREGGPCAVGTAFEAHCREAVDRSHEAFRRLVASSPFGMCTVDADLRLADVSRGACQAFGMPPESLAGRSFEAVIRHAWSDPFASEIVARSRHTLATGEPYHAPSTPNVRSDGGALETYDWRIQRLGMPDGRQGLVCHFYDLSERQRLEAALRESEARFREMADGLPLIIWVHDEHGRQTWVNQTFCQFFGVVREHLGASGWQAVLHEQEGPAYVHAFAEAVRRQTAFNAQVRVMRADGCWHWIESWAQPRFDGAGRFLGHVGTSLDITDRRSAELALRDSERRFRGLAESMPHCVWMCDADGHNIYNNTTWHAYTGTEAGTGGGTTWLDCCHPEERDRLAEAWFAAVRSGGAQPYDVEGRLRRHDGAWRWFRATGVPVRGDDGRIVRWVGTLTDVHEQRLLVSALHEADRRKDAFLATLAHELRNPLAAVSSAVRVLDSPTVAEGRRRWAREVIGRQSRQLSRLIDDLMDVSRINLGRIELQCHRLDLLDALNAAVETVLPLLSAKSHELSLQLPPGGRLWVDGDAARLSQLFQNVLGNAARYTPEGGRITLRAQARDGQAWVEVADEGIGIAPADLARIFEMFSQVDCRGSSSQGGLGIGLYLVQRLVALHGGTVQAHSEGLGRGSRFTVKLPLARPSADAAGPPVSAGADGSRAGGSVQRVLVVDDNEDAAQCTGMLLEMMGHEVRVVTEGPSALLQARDWRPTVVLLDIGLPGMDGEQVARAIRAEPWGRRMRLIALTGWGRDEDRERSRRAGFDAHLVKPVSPDDLEACVLSSTTGAPGG